MTSATPEQARGQMRRLFGAAVDKSMLEMGGRGSCYVKVWRDKPVALLLWFWFTPEAETIAYERAVQAMADNPGARWAVSGQCGYACAGLPRLWNVPFENGPLLDLSIVALGELYAAKSKGLIIEKHNADDYLVLADRCYAFEVEPSKWRITDAGKKFVEAQREAAEKAERVARLGSLAE